LSKGGSSPEGNEKAYYTGQANTRNPINSTNSKKEEYHGK